MLTKKYYKAIGKAIKRALAATEQVYKKGSRDSEVLRCGVEFTLTELIRIFQEDNPTKFNKNKFLEDIFGGGYGK